MCLDARRARLRGIRNRLEHGIAAEQTRTECPGAQPGLVEFHSTLDVIDADGAQRKFHAAVQEPVEPRDRAGFRVTRRDAQIKRQNAVARGAQTGRHQRHKTGRLAVGEHIECFLQAARDAPIDRHHRAVGGTEVLYRHHHATDFEAANLAVCRGSEQAGTGEIEIRVDVVDRRPTRQVIEHAIFDMRMHLEPALAVAERKITQRTMKQHGSVRDPARDHCPLDPGTQTFRQDERDVARRVAAIAVAEIGARLENRRDSAVVWQAQLKITAHAAIVRVQHDVLRLHKPVLRILPPADAARQALHGQGFLENARHCHAQLTALQAELAAVPGQRQLAAQAVHPGNTFVGREADVS